jgi:S-disulfanyl-L-cysteine oxidoreductase SoxD
MEVFTMRRFLNLLVAVTALAGCVVALAQAPTYNLGRTPSEAEIRAWDTAVGVEGKELPPGSGDARQGAPIYAKKCAGCHGPTGKEGPSRILVGGKGTLKDLSPVKTIGSYYPFATTVWDQINRVMPDNKEGSLSAEEIYSLTALLLYWNGIIQENDVLDARSLPKIQMPNRNGFVPPWPPQYKIGEKRLYGQYP